MSRPKPKCDTCQRGERYFEGCSHPECPKRRYGTACFGATPTNGNQPSQEPEPAFENLFDKHK